MLDYRLALQIGDIMVLIQARDGYYMAFAGGTDLTAFDNAQAPIIVGEIKALDWFVSANITHTKPKTVNINPLSATHYPKRLQVGRILGKVASTHYLQTGILSHKVMGKCSTTTANGDPYTKNISKATAEVPHFTALHYEKEGTNANRRKDTMGIIPRFMDISVSERDPIARQTYTGEFAFTGAGGNLAQPTPFTNANLPPYTWFNYKNPSGASEFKYNGGAINVQIVDLHMNFGWEGTLFGEYDAVGYPTDGLVRPPFTGQVDLGVRITDAADTPLNTISDLVHTGYAGDLDFKADFYVGANDYLRYTWDKMYIDPESYEEVFQDEEDWFDGVRFTLRWLDETSSLTVGENSLLDKTYYEND